MRSRKLRVARGTMAYKYKHEDFLKFPVGIRHLDIYLDFLPEGKVRAENKLHLAGNEDVDMIELDAQDLEIEKVVQLLDGVEREVKYSYEGDKLKLEVSCAKGEEVVIKTITFCAPSDNILEGIYKDVTPEGAPQQYMSQCQQWGFQRIMPIIDDCRAKCTMRTTIKADERYTHLISNGNICKETNPDGVPVRKEGRQTITYVNDIPMAPYLFIVAVGTWDTLEDDVEYENGRKVHLEYLVPPGRTEDAKIPMQILRKSVLWIKETQDYEYKRDTYRTICMTKSNFGGMENVGNTTIVTDSALIDEHSLDGHLIYSHAVIVHEFEHNQCGSETTMETPFDVWLNEAYTVNVERDFMAEVFNPAFVRLNQVSSIRDPLFGPLVMEDSGVKGKIQREGFNHPDELIDGLTYVKAAEVIRMLRLIMGEEQFRKAKDIYFSRYKDANANTDQFFECFEEVYGNLEAFKKEWLQRSGYPKVHAKTSFKDNKLTISFTQEQEGKPFHLPIEIALIDDDGNEIISEVFDFKDKEAEVRYDNIGEPAIVSLNRDYSFYGTFTDDKDPSELRNQVLKDTNQFNRVEAMKRLTDQERIRLIKESGYEISQVWIDLYGKLLDENLPPALKARLLSIDETPLDRNYIAWYKELVYARETFLRTINSNFKDKLVELYDGLKVPEGATLQDAIETRMLRNLLLAAIAADEKSEDKVISQFEGSDNAQDKVAALSILNRTRSGKRRELLDKAYSLWKDHTNGYTNYLRVIASGEHEQVFDEIDQEMERDVLDINQPSMSRSLILPMAFNSKMLWTQKGLQWFTDKIIKMAGINAYVSAKMLNAYQLVGSMRTGLKDDVIFQLRRVVDSLDAESTVAKQAKSYLGE